MGRTADVAELAGALDRVMREIADRRRWSGWELVEWLRLKADLLDRLAAAQDPDTGGLAHRAELVRDHAERLADQLTRAPTAPGPRHETEVVRLWARATSTAADPER